MSQTLQVIRERFSCRAFTGEALPNETLDKIAQAAIQSPSSMNRQRWQVIVLRDRQLMAEIEAEGTRKMAEMPDKTLYERIQSRGGKLFYDAPCMIFVPIEPSDVAGAALDCGIVCQTIALAAQSLGVGSCICGLAGLAFSGEKAAYFKEKLRFPAGYEFGMAVLLGEARVSAEAHQPDAGKLTVIG